LIQEQTHVNSTELSSCVHTNKINVPEKFCRHWVQLAGNDFHWC